MAMESDMLIPLPEAWSPENTQAYLSESPLPASFTWRHREGYEAPVVPSYRLTGGYGKWLRETPYFPGLFEEIHGVLARLPDEKPLPFPDELAKILREARRARGEQQQLPINNS